MNKKIDSHKILALKWYKEHINESLNSQKKQSQLPYLYDYPLWPFVQEWIAAAQESIHSTEVVYQSMVCSTLVEVIENIYDIVEGALLECKHEIFFHELCRDCKSVDEINSLWADVAYYLRWHCYSENVLSILTYDQRIFDSIDYNAIINAFQDFMHQWTALLNKKVYDIVSNLLKENEFQLPNNLNEVDNDDWDDFDDDEDGEDDEDDDGDDDNGEYAEMRRFSSLQVTDTYNKCFENLVTPEIYKKHEKKILEIANILGRTASTNETTSIVESMLQYEYPSPPFEDIEGVTSGNRIMDMLPTEFSYFADKTTEILFYQRFASSQLQQFSSFPKEKNKNLQTTSVDTKGPIILCIDTSGSMCGKPMDFAKWLVVKVYDIAKNESRPLYIINFSDRCRTIDLSGENGREELMNFLKDCISGGTSGNEMMQEILLQLESDTYKYADSLIVSDFEFASLKPELSKKVEEAQQKGAKFYGLFVNTIGNRMYKLLLDASWKVEV